jgi:hypothetical protein
VFAGRTFGKRFALANAVRFVNAFAFEAPNQNRLFVFLPSDEFRLILDEVRRLFDRVDSTLRRSFVIDR